MPLHMEAMPHASRKTSLVGRKEREWVDRNILIFMVGYDEVRCLRNTLMETQRQEHSDRNTANEGRTGSFVDQRLVELETLRDAKAPIRFFSSGNRRGIMHRAKTIPSLGVTSVTHSLLEMLVKKTTCISKHLIKPDLFAEKRVRCIGNHRCPLRNIQLL